MLLKFLGPSLIIVYAWRNVICWVMYDEEVTTNNQGPPAPMSVDMYVLIMMPGDHEEIITMLFNAGKNHNDLCKII